MAAAPVWSTSCLDWERRILARESLVPFAPLFPDEAAAALDVFNALRVVDAPHSPTMAQACRPWMTDFVSAIFGSYDADAGRRLINEYMLLISKKNSKSTGAAAIMLTALVRNWRLSAEYIILAPTIEIAKNSFGPAADMVRADPELDDLMLVQEHTRTITHRLTNATLKVVAADNDTVGGKKAVGILVDELWIFGKRPGAENMLREATGGLASRPEGFTIYLTTQSDEPPEGVFRSKLQYARDVRDGKITDNKFLPVLYEFPDALLKAKKHRDKAFFYVTNPNLGASVDTEFLDREYDKALVGGEDSLRGYLAKHLNVEIGLALRADRWTGADHWENQADTSLTLPALLERSEVVTVGIDGGGADDLLGLAVLGRERGTKRWLLWCHAWVHASALKLRPQVAPKLLDLQKDGQLTIVEQLPDDITQLVGVIAEVDAAELLAMVGLDPQGVGAIVDALAEKTIGGELDSAEKERVVGVSQGWKLTSAIKTAERKLIDGTLVHAGQALMAWCVSNAKVEPRGNAVLITKQASGSGKIDPLMAAFCAIALMATNPPAAGGSKKHKIAYSRGQMFD